MGGGGIPAGLRAAEPVALQDREHPPPVLGLRVLPHLKVETHDAPLSRKITFPSGSNNNTKKQTRTSFTNCDSQLQDDIDQCTSLRSQSLFKIIAHIQFPEF